jgi:hypothetical protein
MCVLQYCILLIKCINLELFWYQVGKQEDTLGVQEFCLLGYNVV